MPTEDDEPDFPHQPLLPTASSDYDVVHAPELSYVGGWFIWALTFSAGISGLLFGYDTGVISSTLVTVGSDLSGRDLTTLDKSLITSCTSLFALFASPLTGILADKLGRRKVILGADALFALGALIQAGTSHVGGMIFGRSIVGLAVGSASAVTPLYISELAPSHARGRLVTIMCLLITGGQVVAYTIGWLFSAMPGGWRWIVGLGALPAFLQFAILVFLPETPRWLVQAGFDTRAQNVLSRIYRDCDDSERVVERVMRNIRGEIVQEALELGQNKPLDSKPQWLHDTMERAGDLLRNGGNRRALTIAMMLQGLQQLCGFNSLMYFSATIFYDLNFTSPTLIALSVAGTNFLGTLLAFVLIDRIGRRRILLYSIPVMALALFGCAIAFFSLKSSSLGGRDDPGTHRLLMQTAYLPMLQRSPETESPSLFFPVLIIVFMVIYTAAYALGLGNVPWQQSELFPLNVRSLGSAMATGTNWGSNFIVGLTFLPMMQWISPGWTFTIYALVCTLGWFAVRAIYPEMSGLSLEEVKGLLANGWGVQESLRRRHALSVEIES